jgi:hypothetical protein
MQKGSKSKNMNLSDVAKLHGMTASQLMPQLRKGIKHEFEHTTSKVEARRIALDHLVEFPDYYDRLEKIEKMHLGGDMSMHLAPNGKPSNLTHEQWHLVRTPEFKAWFGDWENDPKNASKVVDKNGEPLVVYHGSPNDFNVFKFRDTYGWENTNKGFYFTYNPYVADIYASVNGLVKPYFLNIRNPYQHSKNIVGFIKEQKKGYDGERGDGMFNSQPFLEIVAYTPEQIKLADGTNTTFDGNNPDIRFDKGGLIAPNGKKSNLTPEQYNLVRTPAFKAWFGDWENDPENSSKVVDSNGEPLVVYHTTDNEFFVFDKKKSKEGFFFSPNKERILVYGKKITKSYFLNIRNPSHELFKTDLKYLIGKGYDGIMDYGFSEKINESLYEIIVFYSNQIKLADGTNTTFDGNNPDIRFKKGGRTIAQTPAPKKDRIYGSKLNKEGSASSGVKRITFNAELSKAIKNKVEEYNERYPDSKVTLNVGKAVVRRGMGAYSKSHRPTISGGAPNSRQAWGLARLNKFLMKKSGQKVKKSYIQDDDLL